MIVYCVLCMLQCLVVSLVCVCVCACVCLRVRDCVCLCVLCVYVFGYVCLFVSAPGFV